MKKSEVKDSKHIKKIFKSVTPELCLLLLAEGGRLTKSKEEKAAMDEALRINQRCMLEIDEITIIHWLSGQKKLLNK